MLAQAFLLVLPHLARLLPHHLPVASSSKVVQCLEDDGGDALGALRWLQLERMLHRVASVAWNRCHLVRDPACRALTDPDRPVFVASPQNSAQVPSKDTTELPQSAEKGLVHQNAKSPDGTACDLDVPSGSDPSTPVAIDGPRNGAAAVCAYSATRLGFHEE